MAADALKAAAALFVCVILQTAPILSLLDPFGASPDLVLVALVAIALLRGSIFGAFAGFWAGFLLDSATLDTLGVTSLLLTIAGFWIGRYGETTGGDRTHAPFVSVVVVTVLATLGGLVLAYVLGESAPAAEVLRSLPPTIAINLILTLPVYVVARRLFPPRDLLERRRQVRVLG